MRYECILLLKRLVQRLGIRRFPTIAPTMLPAVAAVQSLSIPIATVCESTFETSVPPIDSPKIVKHALFIV